jgi:phage-related minor tail protein
MQSGLGVMGEAGPEAIMPLTRGRGGKLGVQASGGGGVLQISLGPGLQAEWLQEAEGRSIQITQAGIAQNNKAMPEMVKAISARPRVR